MTYANANDNNIPYYNPELPESYLGYIDANNLYGWAMCQKLPTSEFKWQDKLLTVSDIMAWNSDSEKGYFIECDVHTNPEDHERFNDLHPFPEYLVIEDGMVSDASRKAMNKRGVNYAAHQKKLAPNLFPKLKHKIHIAALQYYLQDYRVYVLCFIYD